MLAATDAASRVVATHAPAPPSPTLPEVEFDAAPTGQATRLAVLGAGAWGTVLAHLLACNGHEVRLWCRRPAQAAELGTRRRNDRYLPGLKLDDGVRATSDLERAIDGAAAALVAVPTRAIADVLGQLPPVPALVSASKGFLGDDLMRVSEMMRSTHPEALVAALSGPNLAGEVALGLPAAAALASEDDDFGRHVQGWLSAPNLRVYVSSDVAGVEACGALKNVIALAAGMVDGLGLGENARAALITRGLAELVRVGTALGGEARTFYGLAGVGDLVATCGSARSRNHQVGVRIARGEPFEEVTATGLTVEGLGTVRYVVTYAEANGLDLPISREVKRVVYDRKPPEAAMRDLMGRAPRGESEG